MSTSTALATPGETVNRIIELILDGKPLKEATKQCGIDIYRFNRLLQGDKQASLAYARAVEIRADVLADEALQIADTEDDAAKARNQIQVRQWLASKLYAKRYGDRIDLNVTQTLDIGSTLAEARARLALPARDLADVVDVETRAVTGFAGHGASDCESPAPGHDAPPGPDAVPDIFS